MGRKRVIEEKKEGPTSLFILRESNVIRRLTCFLIEWPPFEYTVLLTIIANCVVLAIETPQPNGDKTELARQLVSKFSFLAPIDLCRVFFHPPAPPSRVYAVSLKWCHSHCVAYNVFLRGTHAGKKEADERNVYFLKSRIQKIGT